MLNRDLARRTPGEDLWLARKAAHKTLLEAARLAGVGKDRVVAAEAGKARLKSPFEAVPDPSVALLLALARRRSGYTLDEVAARTGTSRVTVLARERRADPKLIGFWARKGFTFGDQPG